MAAPTPPGVPVNQWQELNHSKRWSSYFLWQHGQPIAEHLARCPETARALEAVDMADIALFLVDGVLGLWSLTFGGARTGTHPGEISDLEAVQRTHGATPYPVVGFADLVI